MPDSEKSEKKRSIQGLTLEQLRRRRWMQSRGRWVFALASVAVLVIVAVWLFYFSSVLAVKHVTVTGTATSDVQQVESAADAPMGSPLIDANLGQIRRRVEALPWVASAVVSRSWPQTITIAVTPRTPVAVVQTDHGLQNIDATGVIFGHRAAQPRGLPLITLSGQVDHSALLGAATVAGSLPASVLRQVTSIAVRTMDDIQLNLTNGRQVFWGSASDSAIKAEVAVALLHHHNTIINVSVPSQPTTG